MYYLDALTLLDQCFHALPADQIKKVDPEFQFICTRLRNAHQCTKLALFGWRHLSVLLSKLWSMVDALKKVLPPAGFAKLSVAVEGTERTLAMRLLREARTRFDEVFEALRGTSFRGLPEHLVNLKRRILTDFGQTREEFFDSLECRRPFTLLRWAALNSLVSKFKAMMEELEHLEKHENLRTPATALLHALLDEVDWAVTALEPQRHLTPEQRDRILKLVNQCVEMSEILEKKIRRKIRGVSDDEVEEVLEETLVRLQLAGDQYDPDQGKVEQWIYRSLGFGIWECISRKRRGSKFVPMDFNTHAGNAPEWQGQLELEIFAVLKAKLEQLAFKHRYALTCHYGQHPRPDWKEIAGELQAWVSPYVADWNTVKMAEALDESPKWVKVEIQGARKKIARELGSWLGDSGGGADEPFDRDECLLRAAQKGISEETARERIDAIILRCVATALGLTADALKKKASELFKLWKIELNHLRTHDRTKSES